MEAQISFECIKPVHINNYLWKSIPGWNGPIKKHIASVVLYLVLAICIALPYKLQHWTRWRKETVKTRI